MTGPTDAVKQWHDRLGAMIDQIGRPDYSMRDFIAGIRTVRDEMMALRCSPPSSEDALRNTKAGDWLPLLEIFAPGHVLLHGAAGEDAMNVGDVVALVRELAKHQSAQSETQRRTTPRRLACTCGTVSWLLADGTHYCGDPWAKGGPLDIHAAPSPSGVEESKDG